MNDNIQTYILHVSGDGLKTSKFVCLPEAKKGQDFPLIRQPDENFPFVFYIAQM